MPHPRLVPFAALLALATTLAAQEDPGGRTPAAVFIERVDVNVVNVEVFVTDKAGNRVAGLTADDFEIFEDRRPVEISNFYATSRPDRVDRDLERDRELVSREPAVETPAVPEDQRLNLAIYVDHHNLHPSTRQRVLGELEGFVEDRVIQGDRVMLVSYTRTLQVVEPFTADRQRLVDGLRGMGRVAANGPIKDSQLRQTMREMNAAAAAGQPTFAHQHLRSYVQQTISDLRRSTDALSNMVRALAGLPGRKAILYVSDGLPKRPGEELYQHLQDLFGAQGLRTLETSDFVDPSIEALNQDQGHLFDAIIRDANAHQVTFYTLDARGSGGASTLSAQYFDLVTGAGGPAVFDSLRTMNLQEPLVDMAETTGGSAILNTFNFDDALESMAEDFETFYSLGYRSPLGGDGKYHRIEVKVKRPDLKVRYRAGYVDKPQQERVADRTLSSLLLELAKNPLGIAVDVGRPTKESGDHLLPIMVRIPIREISLLPQGETEEGRLRIYLVVKDEDGISAIHDEPYPVSIPREMVEEARQREIGYSVRLKVRPGQPTVAVGVWDELSGVESFVHQEVRVGKQKKKTGGR